MKLRAISQALAKRIDEWLMLPAADGGGGWPMDLLMELAGLSIAEAIHKVYRPAHGNVLILAGPGNNGGDGLVAARWLSVFGWRPTVWYPTRVISTSKSPLYARLVNQCEQLNIPILDNVDFPKQLSQQSDTVIVDAIFGFGYKLRASGISGAGGGGYSALAEAVSALASCTNSGTAVPVVAVDVPSGWPVDGNDAVNPSDYMPDMLISLTAPKLCARHFTGRYHFLGGRGFMSARLSNQFSLSLPLHSFQGCDHSFHIIDDIIDFETAHD